MTSIGREPSAYGKHSMRRSKVSRIHRKTGNLHAVQRLPHHTKMDSRARYLGVYLEDALTISQGAGIPSRRIDLKDSSSNVASPLAAPYRKISKCLHPAYSCRWF